MGGVLQTRRQTLERAGCKPLKGSTSELSCNVSDLPTNTSRGLESECASVQTHRSKEVSGPKCRDSPVTFTGQSQAIFFIARRNRHWHEQVWFWKSPAIIPLTGLDEKSQFNSVLWSTASLTPRCFSRFPSVYRLFWWIEDITSLMSSVNQCLDKQD